MKALSECYEITRSRCKARNGSGGFYFDPVTFDSIIAPPGAVPAGPKRPEKDETEGIDKVFSCYCFVALLTPLLDP
jgi:hypothetical protein